MNNTKLDKLYGLMSSTDALSSESLKNKAVKLAKYSPALLLAGVVPAEAQIICNDGAAPILVPQFSSAFIDVDGDSVYDFDFQNSSFFGGVNMQMGANPYVSNYWIASLNAGSSFYSVGNLSAGFSVGSALPAGYYFGGFGTLAISAYSWGNFLPPSNGYVGVQFDIGGNNHFGWIELTTAGTDLTIEGFCYEATPDRPIPAGSRLSEIVPTLGEWSLITLNLLLLIFGVTAVRQRKGKLALKKV